MLPTVKCHLIRLLNENVQTSCSLNCLCWLISSGLFLDITIGWAGYGFPPPVHFLRAYILILIMGVDHQFETYCPRTCGC